MTRKWSEIRREKGAPELVAIEQPRWLAQLKDAEWVLTQLAHHFGDQPIAIARNVDNDTWWLASERFDGLATSSEVNEVAKSLVSVLQAIARTRIGSGADLELTGSFLERIDDRAQRPHWILEGEFEVFPRGHPELADKPDGRSWEQDVLLAERDRRVSRVLAFLAAPRSWQSLYAAFEIVLKDGRIGRRQGIVARGWATSDEIRDFMENANTFGGAGIFARHGLRDRPPRRRLTHMEAESIVYCVVRGWLDELTR